MTTAQEPWGHFLNEVIGSPDVYGASSHALRFNESCA